MTVPIILVHSGTGSDTAASGAGPTTALTGTSNASTDATGLIVTLGGSPDLSGVATDGTHVLFLNDSTAGARNFGSIVAADNSAKTVTITTGEAFRASVSGLTWAIGGVRASVNGTTSSKLTSNNSASGDAMPGWTIRMLSGHVESGGTINMRRLGTLAGGFVTLEGEPNAATRPVYTSSANGVTHQQAFQRVRNFDLRKSGSSGNTGVAMSANSVCFGMRFLDNSGVKFATGVTTNSGCTIENNYIQTVTGVGLSVASECREVRNNVVTGCGTFGIELTSSNSNRPTGVINNIVYSNSSDGIRISMTSDAAIALALRIENNVIHGNTGDGIEFICSNSQRAAFQQLLLANNQITSNGGFGINFSGASVTDLVLSRLGARVANNNFGSAGSSTNNTSGICNFTLTLTGSDNVELNPQYTNAASGDFSIGTNAAALGFPLTAIGSAIVAGNRSYVDIGALQRQEPTGGGGWGFRRRPRTTGI